MHRNSLVVACLGFRKHLYLENLTILEARKCNFLLTSQEILECVESFQSNLKLVSFNGNYVAINQLLACCNNLNNFAE